MIKLKNFSREQIVNFKPKDGDVIESCNLMQAYPHTKIAEGISGLVYRNCNLINCDVTGIVEGCNNKHISKCGNLHAGYVCVEDCEHVVSVEDIMVDGVVIVTLREYADKVVD